MRAARVRAQAKVNISLRVLHGRDADGYHALFTVFHRIDLADEVVVRIGGTGRSLDVAGPCMPAAGLGPAERNLAFRAAVAYAQRSGGAFPGGFAIEITKNIPVGGGLGGGSADAAAVLRALHTLHPQGVGAPEILETAASLGSDVPFLASDMVAALGTGRGDRIVATPAPRPAKLLLVVPRFSIATADAYRWLDADRASDGVPATPDASGLADLRHGWAGFVRSSSNDFEPVVERRHPELRAIREHLVAGGAILARLAGSGSCVFGVFNELPSDVSNIAEHGVLLATRTSASVVQVEVLE